MERIEYKIQTALISEWNDLKLCMQRLKPSASLVPEDGLSVFRHVPNEDRAVAIFELDNIMFNLPERATDTKADLYVVVRGRLIIDREHYSATRRLRTLSFATEAGYFRIKNTDPRVAVHVYGAHYDFSEEETGHPVFHVQMKSFAQFHEVIKKAFGEEDLACEDGMKKVLKTVRLPSAQMDVFSFFVQLIADHLLWSDSSEAEREEFSKFIEKDKNLQGAGILVERLHGPPASQCYRAVHWYPPEP